MTNRTTPPPAKAASPDALERHYSVSDLMALFHVGEDGIRDAISRGDLRATKVGRAIRIPESAVNEWLTPVVSAKDGDQ